MIITATKYESQSQGCHKIYRNTQKKTSIWEHSCTNYQVQYGFILPVGSIFTSVSEIIWWPSLKFNEWQKSVSYFSSNWNMFSKIIFDGFFQGPRNPCRIAIFVRLLFGWTTLRFFWAVEKASYHALHLWRCYFGTFSTLYEPHLWTIFSGNYLVFQFHTKKYDCCSYAVWNFVKSTLFLRNINNIHNFRLKKFPTIFSWI